MREQLDALVTELRRLRRDGVSRVSVSESSLASLRALVASVKTGDKPESAGPGGGGVPPPVPGNKASSSRDKPSPETVRETPAPAGPASTEEKVTIPVVEKPMQPAAPKPAGPDSSPVEKPLPEPPVIALPAGDAPTRFAGLRAKLLADPVALARVTPGKSLVAFDGSPEAPVLFLIPMPGPDDAVAGLVLAGAEGGLYGKIVAAMGLPRARIVTTSLLPYRPEIDGGHDHREPAPDEIAYFLPYLRALLETVKPRAIVALGGGAQDALFGKSETISKSRGRWREFDGIPVMPTYHISYLIRNNTNKSKRVVWEDMLAVMERLGLPVSEKQREYFK